MVELGEGMKEWAAVDTYTVFAQDVERGSDIVELVKPHLPFLPFLLTNKVKKHKRGITASFEERQFIPKREADDG